MSKAVYVVIVCLASMFSLTAMAASNEGTKPEIFVVPQWVTEKNDFFASSTANEPVSERSCLKGQWRYKYRYDAFVGRPSYGLLGMVIHNIPIQSKSAYYSYATYLGYFSDDPAEKAEIAEKVKPIVDNDLQEMRELMARKPYFLFVGNFVRSYNSGSNGDYDSIPMTSFATVSIGLPTFEAYDWNNGQVIMRSRVEGSIQNSQVIQHLDAAFPVTPQEWKELFTDTFGSRKGREKLATRLLLNSQFEPVIAEVFMRDTGRTLLKWAPKGIDVDKFSALIPDVPATEYEFGKNASCNSLNMSYFSVDTQSQSNNEASSISSKLMSKMLPGGLPKLW